MGARTSDKQRSDLLDVSIKKSWDILESQNLSERGVDPQKLPDIRAIVDSSASLFRDSLNSTKHVSVPYHSRHMALRTLHDVWELVREEVAQQLQHATDSIDVALSPETTVQAATDKLQGALVTLKKNPPFTAAPVRRARSNWAMAITMNALAAWTQFLLLNSAPSQQDASRSDRRRLKDLRASFVDEQQQCLKGNAQIIEDSPVNYRDQDAFHQVAEPEPEMTLANTTLA